MHGENTPELSETVALPGPWLRLVDRRFGPGLRRTPVRLAEVLRLSNTDGRTDVRTSRGRGLLSHLDLDHGMLAVALLAGTVLRVAQLGRVGLNSDEAVYAGQSASLMGNPHFTANFPVVRAHPLLFQLAAAPLYRAGNSGPRSAWARSCWSSCWVGCSTRLARVR